VVNRPWSRQPQIEPHLTNQFKNLVRQQAKIIKQDVYKDGWMRAWITSKTAHEKHIPGYESTTIGDLGPTPQFITRGLSDRENNVGFGNARDYYTHLTYGDITRQIINQPQFLKNIYDESQEFYNEFVNKAREAGIEPTNTQIRDFKKKSVRNVLLNTYYLDKDSLMGDIQRDAIVNQSLMVSVANAATAQQTILQKFKPDHLMDLFPEGILPYTSKRILQLRSRGVSPEDIKKQVQVEEDFFKARDIHIDDLNLERFNTFINACFAQALANDGGINDFDIDNLIALDSTYAFDGGKTKMKERAQRIMRHVKDPKTAYMWYILELQELRRRENWWRNYI